MKGAGHLTFRCNVCGTTSHQPLARFGREEPTCAACLSSVRMRAIVHGVSVALWGRPLCLPDFPVDRRVRGLGLSDWEPYAAQLEKKLGYTNTYYHQEPRLDITAPIDSEDLAGAFDFIVSTDVFEHVAPPVAPAFENLRRLLKDSGVLIFSVPFQPGEPTVEHFPDLHEYSLLREGDQYVLRNRTRDGRLEEFRDLHFHGGLGSTLEMRVFGYDDLVRCLADAGFQYLFPLNRPYFEYGIVHAASHSYPFLASPQPLDFSIPDCFDWVTPGAAARVAVDGPAITAWGPQSAGAGERVIFWFTGQELRSTELRVLLNGQRLADAVTSADGVTLTSAVPEAFTHNPGRCTVEVMRGGATLLAAPFEVRVAS